MTNKLLGLQGDVNTLFEFLLFEIEENFDFYRTQNINLILKPISYDIFKVTQIIFFKDTDEITEFSEKNSKILSWFAIQGKRVNDKIFFMLQRTNLTAKFIEVEKDKVNDFFQEGCIVDPDEHKQLPLTDSETRLAFQDLAPLFSSETSKELKPKKAM